MNLRIPGPTPLPPSVREAVSRDMINHRGPEFARLLHETVEGLKHFFQTSQEVLLLTGSGTGGMEAVVVNLFSPGEKVLVASIGHFGQRFGDICRAFGLQVQQLDFPMGTAADPDVIGEQLRADPEISAVLVTHNDTSTGVTNDIEAIAKVVKAADRMLVVDAVSSLGAIELKMDEWGVDAVVTGSQKAWMAPPGLAMVALSQRAWDAHARKKLPCYYWDFTAARKSAAKGETPWTPAVSTVYGLHAALQLMLAEGMPAIFERHRRIGRYVRDGLKQMGLRLFADERYASDTVTAVWAPDGISAKDVIGKMQEDHGVVITGGQGSLAGRILRIGHIGYVDVPDIQMVLEALSSTLQGLGYSPAGAGKVASA